MAGLPLRTTFFFSVFQESYLLTHRRRSTCIIYIRLSVHEKLTATNKTPKLCTLHAVSRNPTACWSSGSAFVWSLHVMGSTVYTVHFRCVKICRNLTHANCLITRNFQSYVNRSKYIFWSTMSRFFFSQYHGYMLYFLPKCPNLSIPDKISRSRKNFVFFSSKTGLVRTVTLRN